MEKIVLSNYRCFESLLLNFSGGVNLLIGDNASGKTTLIHALSAVLNSFFIGFSDENTRFIGLSRDDFRIVGSEEGLVNEEPIAVNFRLLGQMSRLVLESKKGRTRQTPLDNIRKLAHGLQQQLFQNDKQILALPLFARFSTSDIHSKRKLNKETFKQYVHKPSFGYYECLQGDGFLEYWTTRLLVLREGNTGEMEVQGVINGILQMLGASGCNVLSEISIRPIRGKVYFQLTDGRMADTETLSDGLRRLVNIGLDLAFRCMLLNKGIYGLEACEKTEGTVLIDEIDLHLHPSLQSVVVKGLQNAFPKLQFIITTHAPMVMSGIPQNEGNKIIQLSHSAEEGYTAKEISAYGLDASTIIESVLGVIPRYKVVDDQLNTLFHLIDSNQFEEARKFLGTMRKEFGERLPELARAESMLNFLTTPLDD